MSRFLKTFSFFALCLFCSVLASSIFFSVQPVQAGMDADLTNDVSGFAWSDNIGWISFSCNDLSSCGRVQYGVEMSDTTGNLSGYAWSDGIGWISFNAANVSGCPSGSCTPTVNSSSGAVSGWARALSAVGHESEGWDGWISLRGSTYGVSYNSSTGFFSGFAWGSEVIGWISFNKTDTGSSVNYAVLRTGNKTTVAMSCGVTGTNATATIRWPAVAGATSYHLHRSTTENGQYTDIGAGNQTSYVDKGLAFNTTYYYKIVAANSAGGVISTADAVSQSTSGVCDGFPGAPSNLSVSPACSVSGGAASANLSWSASTGAATITYNIYRSTSELGTYTLVGSSNTATYVDDDLGLGETYYYKIEATNSVGTSDFSSTVSVSTSGSCVTPAGAVAGYSSCTSTTSTDALIHLSWNDSLGQAPIVYHILKSTGGGFSEIGHSSVGSYVDEGNELSSTVTYQIKTIDGTGNSAVTPSIPVLVQSSCNRSEPGSGTLGIDNFRAAPPIGNPGYMCTLSWKLSGYDEETTCDITGKHSVRPFNPNEIGPNGTQQIYNILTSTPFTLTCTQGDTGEKVQKLASCNINPKVIEIN